MNRTFWWVALVVGGVGLMLALAKVFAPTPSAPLNASGYTYPSTSGA